MRKESREKQEEYMNTPPGDEKEKLQKELKEMNKKINKKIEKLKERKKKNNEND